MSEVWLVLAMALLSGSASAQALHPIPPVGLAWRMKPTADDMASYYPPKAQKAEQAGWAVVECLTTTAGKMKDCHLLREAPAGFGFGEAGLKLSSKFWIDAAKTDPAILEGGVIMIPIVMLTPLGAPPPVLDHLAGQPAALVTVAKDKGKNDFACPSAAAPDRQCRTHSLKWRKAPSLVEGAALVRSANATSGRSTLQCWAQADLHLTACATREVDPARRDAMLALAALLIAPEQAEDMTPTTDGAIIIDFNWASLRAAVDASVLTKTP